MITFTKEQLIEHLRTRIEHRKGLISSMHIDRGYRDYLKLELLSSEIALASLEAEAVAWLWSHRKHPSEVTLVRPEDDERAEGAHWSGWSCQALYAAPPATESVPDDIDTRMKNAGMLSASEIIAGQPIDAFMKHAGVVDLESLLKWAEMRRAEFLRMQAKYELGDNQKDDMYEWVISHVAAFSELHVNIRAAMLQGAENAESPTTIHAAPALDSSPKIAESTSGNSPVIPDGWVACSERMPTKQDGTVFLTWNGQYIGKELFLMGSFQCLKPEIITHWMPLPTAPQQEV